MSSLQSRAWSVAVFLAVSVALPLGLGSCCRRPANAPEIAGKHMALKVNGVAVSEMEVAMETRHGHGVGEASQSRDKVLEGIVLEEAMAQRAVALGMEKDQTYLERMARVEAQRAAQRRKELAHLFYKHEVLDKVAVTDAEAKAFYDSNQARIRTEMHVAQVLTRDQAEAARDLKDLKDGKSFDEVAARRYPKLPDGMKPWDLGFIKWKNAPEQWYQPLSTLTPGQTSDIIKGPGDRFWIVKLIEKRDNPALTFEATKADVIEVLKGRKAKELGKRVEEEVLRSAKVEKFAPPPAQATPTAPPGHPMPPTRHP